MVWQLFISFLKIGAFTFGGGYAMIPLIQNEVTNRRKWLTDDEFLSQLTIAQSLPGPISLNTSVFVGYKMRGLTGAITAMLGVVIPSFVTILAIIILFYDYQHAPMVQAAFKGMRPAVVALIATPVLKFMKGMSWWKIASAIIAAIVVWRLGVSPVYFMLLGAAVGIYAAFRAEKGGQG
ncbi:MAG: chromate transporter [Tidjanibacter sp.]|nr:chromate transporter [Tidjanibacter sp.]